MSYLKHKPGSIEEMMANQAKKLNDNAYQDMFKKELEKAGRGIGAMSPKEKKDFFNKIDDKYKAKNEEEVSKKDVDKFHTSLDKLVHKSFGHSSDEKKKEVKEEDAYDKDDEKPKSKPKKEAVDNPYAVGMAAAMKAKDDKPPLKKSTITKAHDIAKSIKKDQKEEESIKEASYPHKMYSKDGKEVEAKTPEDHKKYAEMGYTHKNETHSFMTKDMNKSKKDAKGEKEIVDPEPKLKQESIQDTIANVWKMSAEELEKIKTEAKYMKAQRMSQYKAEDEKNKKGTADTGSKATKVDVEPSVDYKN